MLPNWLWSSPFAVIVWTPLGVLVGIVAGRMLSWLILGEWRRM